jgi:hypothetical protein
MEVVRSCIYSNNVDLKFWAKAMEIVVYTLNMTCFETFT